MTAQLAAYTTTKPVNWTQKTCAAEQAYAAHPSTAGLNALVVDSTHLGKSYLRADVGQLEADASSPSAKAKLYVTDDVTYIYEDCTGGRGL